MSISPCRSLISAFRCANCCLTSSPFYSFSSNSSVACRQRASASSSLIVSSSTLPSNSTLTCDNASIKSSCSQIFSFSDYSTALYSIYDVSSCSFRICSILVWSRSTSWERALVSRSFSRWDCFWVVMVVSRSLVLDCSRCNSFWMWSFCSVLEVSRSIAF